MMAPTPAQATLLMRLLGIITLAGALVLGGCRWQASRDAAAIAAAEVTAATLQAGVTALAEAAKQADARALQASKDLTKRAREADTRYEALETKAARDAAALASALRTGKQRLSDTWACGAPASAGGAATDAGSPASERRADSAARIITAADTDAATIGWLYDRWLSERRAVIAAGCAVEEG
jgi:hypothetical protein